MKTALLHALAHIVELHGVNNERNKWQNEEFTILIGQMITKYYPRDGVTRIDWRTSVEKGKNFEEKVTLMYNSLIKHEQTGTDVVPKTAKQTKMEERVDVGRAIFHSDSHEWLRNLNFISNKCQSTSSGKVEEDENVFQYGFNVGAVDPESEFLNGNHPFPKKSNFKSKYKQNLKNGFDKSSHKIFQCYWCGCGHFVHHCK